MTAYYTWQGFVCGECDGINIDGISYSYKQIKDILSAQDRLPIGHMVLEQAEMTDGRVSQTVRKSDGSEYERIVDADEAYGL